MAGSNEFSPRDLLESSPELSSRQSSPASTVQAEEEVDVQELDIDHGVNKIEWEDVKVYLEDNNLDYFFRLPSVMKKYSEDGVVMKATYGSVAGKLKALLKWEDFIAKGNLFSHQEDFKFTYNNYPYAWEDGVVHLVVWCKFALPDDPETGRIAGYVSGAIEKLLAIKCANHKDELLWWRNPPHLKSVPELEHFHILLRNPSAEFLTELNPVKG
ncbi:hypothetical protein BT63DRAFT_416940 [Microthyrium microscopicum]|uniref:Uncharacterized protein n=1 Tax=Microthyrium microscopicum TaxID=703497 RepID=A0A6A6U150_9PEZI|nr:hypothetical protein BT63DRAFT_416940 [Microthyrium microscopicum]